MYAPIFGIIQKYFSDNHKLPTVEVLEAEVMSKAPSDKKPLVSGILTNIKNTKTANIENSEIIKGLKDRLLLTVIDSQIKTLTQATMAKDTEKIREVLNGIVEEVNIGKVKPLDFHEAMFAPDVSKIIPSGIEGLDDCIVGFGGLTIISGSSGSGKSALMLEAAIGQYKLGLNVLFISLELSAQVLGKRLQSNITSIPFGKVITGNLTPGETQRLDLETKAFFNRPNHFRIITTPMDSEELLNLIKVEKALYDIDVVYVDYLNLIGTPKGSEGGWLALSNAAKALHRLSMEIGVVTVTAAQADLLKIPKAGAFPEIRTRGSAELLFSATLMIYLYKPELDAESATENPIIAYCMKNRNGKTMSILMSADFSLMRYTYITEL